MTEKYTIEIECPHCFKDNSIDLSKKITCQHCQKTLINEHYMKPVIKATTAILSGLIIGAGTGVVKHNFFDVERYPIHVEYSIIDNCISAYNEPLSRRVYGRKRDICEAALEKTEEEISYHDYKKNQMEFLNEFEKQAYLIMLEK